MGRFLNKVFLLGNVTDDIKIENANDEDKVCNFFIATNRSWTTKDGVKSEATEYHKVIAWNKIAEYCEQFLKKGSKVHITGRLSTYKYEDKDGNKRVSTEIVIEEFIALE